MKKLIFVPLLILSGCIPQIIPEKRDIVEQFDDFTGTKTISLNHNNLNSQSNYPQVFFDLTGYISAANDTTIAIRITQRSPEFIFFDDRNPISVRADNADIDLPATHDVQSIVPDKNLYRLYIEMARIKISKTTLKELCAASQVTVRLNAKIPLNFKFSNDNHVAIRTFAQRIGL